LTLGWNAATDNTGITGYDIYQSQNGDAATKIGTTANTSFPVTGLTANTAYTYYVIATDAAGNHSGQSTTIAVTTTNDGGGGGSGDAATNNALVIQRFKGNYTGTYSTTVWDENAPPEDRILEDLPVSVGLAINSMTAVSPDGDPAPIDNGEYRITGTLTVSPAGLPTLTLQVSGTYYLTHFQTGQSDFQEGILEFGPISGQNHGLGFDSGIEFFGGVGFTTTFYFELGDVYHSIAPDGELTLQLS